MNLETRLSAIHSRSDLHVEVHVRATSAGELRKSLSQPSHINWDHLLGLMTAIGVSAAGWTAVAVSVTRVLYR